MRPAPVRRMAATGGLIALVPIALRLYQGVLTPIEAALRALGVLAVVLLLTSLAGWGLHRVLVAVERDEEARRARRAAEEPVSGQVGQ